MTTNPPYALEGKTLDDLPDLAVEVDELKTECDCDFPEEPAYPGEGEIDPTTVKSYDKWWLRQCKTCGAVFWTHNVQADYGDDRMGAYY